MNRRIYNQAGSREVITARTETVGARIRRVLLMAAWFCVAAVIVAGVVTILPALLAAAR